jgi:hypothetical protein
VTDLPGLLRALVRDEVAFIVVGGVAATIHGSARLTPIVDVVYRRTPRNVERLVRALRSLHPYLRDVPPGLPFRWDEQTVAAGLNFSLSTDLGDIDLFADVPGGRTWEDLSSHVLDVTAFGTDFRCVDLPTLIRLKRAAGRPRDLEAIGELERLWEERSDGGVA